MPDDDPQRPADLELSPEEMLRLGRLCLQAAVQHIQELPQAPRSDLAQAEAIACSLREDIPEQPADFETLLQLLFEKVFPTSINTAHPAYMGYIPGGGLYPSALADFLAAAANRYVGVWYAGPAAARLEANVLDWFARLLDYPETARGILTSGGSLANFSAIVTARHHLLGDDLSRGTLYATTQTHHSVMKSAMLAGIPEKNIRLLQPGENFRADPIAFEATMQADRARGLQPFLVVGNAGTTNSGAVDPLPDLAALAEKYGCWLHVDGAYGGFFYFCEAGKKRLRGLPLADSMVLDPHKGLFVPYGTGCLLVKNGELLRKAHMLTSDYLQDQYTPEDECNFTEYSPELSRSFRGLRVWLPLKLFGLPAFQHNLAEKLALTEWMYNRFLETPGFECPTTPDLSVITFRYLPRCGDAETFNRKLQAKIIASKKLFLSSTLLNGTFVIRVCILSFRTHKTEVIEAFDIIRDAAQELERT